jgi:hypothetical protein
MIQLTCLSTAIVGQDTSLVELKYKLVSLDCYRNRLHGNGSQQAIFVTSRDIVECANNASRDISAIHGVAHFTLLCFVWIVSLGTKPSALLVEFESVIHQSTTASHVRVITVQKVLLTEGNQFTRFNKFGTFQRTCCGKGPADDRIGKES